MHGQSLVNYNHDDFKKTFQLTTYIEEDAVQCLLKYVFLKVWALYLYAFYLDIPSVDIPSKSKVTFGSETGLFCRVSGYPPPNKVEWQSSVDRTTFHPIDIDKDKYFGSSTDPPSPFLLVRNATLNDQQYYRIVVSNVIGKCISSTLFLQVTGGICFVSVSFFYLIQLITII